MQEQNFAGQFNNEQFAVLQNERFKHVVEWSYERSRFYREKFDNQNIVPSDIKDLSDIYRLPFTVREDFSQHSPYDFLTLPLSGIVRINMLGENAGLVKMYTARDVACNIALSVSSLQNIGVNKASVVALLADDLQGSINDVQNALEGIGAAVVPLNVETESMLRLFDTLGIDTVVGTPKKVIKMIVQLQALGRDILELQLQRIICINDSLHNPLKLYLRQRVNTKIFNILSLDELGYTGIMFQCRELFCQHFREDLFYPEIVAFGSDEVIEDYSHMGELVITTLAAEAMPILRYRTGQAVMRSPQECSCGNGFRCFNTLLSE